MTHLDEAQLIAHALGDDDPAAREQSAVHLAACAACRRALADIREVLDVTSAVDVPPRGEEYGSVVWARLEPRLPRPATVVPRLSWGWFGVAAAVVLLVAASFLAGRWSRSAPERGVPAVASAPSPAAVRERVVRSALGEHLDRAERALVEVANADAAGVVDVSAEQAWARDLLAANRLYRQSVRGASSPVVLELLDELEPVLVELVNGPSRMTGSDLDALQARIEARGLVFKLRAARTVVRAQPSPRPAGEPIS